MAIQCWLLEASCKNARPSLSLMPMQQLEKAVAIPGIQSGKKALLVFFETDCPTCQLALPYLNALKNDTVQVIGLSQDDEAATQRVCAAVEDCLSGGA